MVGRDIINNLRRVRGLRLAVLALLVPTVAGAQVGKPQGEAAFDSAFFAWERGDYRDALRRFERLVRGADAARYVEPIAQLTGELYQTVELTTDGAVPRWSPDGRYASFESGARDARRTHIVSVEGGRVQRVATIEGAGLVFDGAGKAAYIAGAPPRIVLRELTTGRETTLPTPGLNPQSIVFRRGEATVYVLAPTGSGSSDVYRLGGAEPVRVTSANGTKTNPVWLAGDRLLYSIDRQSFAIQNLTSGQVEQHRASDVAVSADGSAIAYVRQDESMNVITVQRFGAVSGVRDVVRRREQLAAPTLSRDGGRLAYQAMPREDWEVYTVNTSDSSEVRITREIQHDLLPRFVNDTTILAVMGEARHRRSYLYDARTGARTRLFHNNSVRTVAPEYEWVLSPDGGKVLIVAERDGDTVSPERGVYMMDLTRRVTLEDVRARVQVQLADEQELRTTGERHFAGLEAQVRQAVNDVTKDRVYRYSYDLYQFDSKYITQPGNAKAIEYIAAKLREFGYEPELQWFEPRRGADGAPVRTANVIAKLPGVVQQDVLYVVSSHFDSVQRGPGADDDTSGTAALLEAARVLAKRPQPATIHFAFFTGEEAGLLGSREYVRRAVERGDKLVGALNNDMIGFANDQRLDNTIRYSNDGIRDIQHAAAFLFTNLITYDAKYYKSTDAAAYYDAYGDIVGGIGSYPILGNPHYHQPHDQLETINHQLVAEVAKTTVATLMKLTNAPSRPKLAGAEQTGDALTVRWQPLPERDLGAYVVEVIGADGRTKSTQQTRETTLAVRNVARDDTVLVWGTNARGVRSWDALRVTAQSATAR